MRAALVALAVPALVALAAPRARADRTAPAPTWAPLRVHLVCQGWSRTKVCPAFVRGFIDETQVLVYAPRAAAQVVLYVATTFRENDDRVLLRFTASLPGAPAAFEVTQDVSTRASDDAQRDALRPAFLRGVAPFVAAVLPAAVEVTLTPPEAAARAAPSTSPWSFEIYGGGFWNWSDQYQSANFWGGTGASRTTGRDRASLSVGGFYQLSRSPDLVADDGTRISLDTDAYGLTGTLLVAHNLDGCTSVGAVLRGGGEDPIGRYHLTGRAHVGLSRDWFASDDPRGNDLSLSYFLGVQADRYNIPNEIGETRALFPTHGVVGNASVRKDQVTYELSLSAFAQLQPRADAPRRYVLEASPSLELQLGAHVDLAVNLEVTKQQAPGPDEAAVDPNDYEQLSRLQYAEPLRISMFFRIRLHWDRSDPDRNNRFSAGYGLGELGTL